MMCRRLCVVTCAVMLFGCAAGALDLRRQVRFIRGYEHVETWDGESANDPWLILPFDARLSNDSCLYITDLSRRMLVKCPLENGLPVGAEWALFGGWMERPFLWPMSVALTDSPDRSFYVADFLAEQVRVFDESRAEVQVFESADGAGQIKGPRGVAYTPGFFNPWRLYITDFTRNCVFRLSDGQWSRWGGAGSGPGQFNKPCGIACSADGGFVYVVDRDNHRIQQFDQDGDFVKQWGGRGDGRGQFLNPEGIAVSQSGAIFVTDTGNNRVQKFNASGGSVVEWGQTGDKNDAYGFRKPRGIAVSSSGWVYVCDSENGALKIYKPR